MGLLDNVNFSKKKGEGSYLQQQYPEILGALKGLLGTAPDEVGGSVLDGSHQAMAQGAGVGFPLGTIAQLFPMAGLTKGLPVGASIKDVGKKFVYPQEKALATAQANAAKPLSEGGLGLHHNNTPMERAQAMGFDTDAFHTSRHGIDTNVLDSGKYAMAPFDAIGTHFGTKDAALDRFNRTVGTTEQFKGSTYPVLLDGSKPLLNKQGAVFNEEPLMMSLSEKADYGNLPVSNAAQRDEIFSNNSVIPYINDVEGAGSISYIAPPKNIRSRFAAFDPFRRDSPDLLAGALPFTAFIEDQKKKK